VTLLGSWLGNITVVKNNIEAILILIVLVSVNLRPLGYEPSELPSCSTPRRRDESTSARSAP
ncbi:hypothetical protein ACWD3G_35015, partial [Streptomyces sp. NPDC002692]